MENSNQETKEEAECLEMVLGESGGAGLFWQFLHWGWSLSARLRRRGSFGFGVLDFCCSGRTRGCRAAPEPRAWNGREQRQPRTAPVPARGTGAFPPGSSTGGKKRKKCGKYKKCTKCMKGIRRRHLTNKLWT